MLTTPLVHPDVLAALGRAGHGSRVLIADGHYPVVTATSPIAERVFLNLAPGIVDVTQVLRAVVSVIAVEAAAVMDYARSGPHALDKDPSAWGDYRDVLTGAVMEAPLERLERHDFYQQTRGPEVALAIATADQRTYANLLLTIGSACP